MAESSFDLLVVGGGPGGYVAAIRAAQLGMKTALVEREHLGGICLNWGCIPTKALLRASEIHHLLNHLDQFGFSAGEVSYDAKKVVARSRAVAKQLSNGVAFLLRKNKVTVFDGEARLAGKGKLGVTKEGKAVADLAAKHIILATGARARSLPGLEPDGKLVWMAAVTRWRYVAFASGSGWSPNSAFMTTVRASAASSACALIRSAHSRMMRSASWVIFSSL